MFLVSCETVQIGLNTTEKARRITPKSKEGYGNGKGSGAASMAAASTTAAKSDVLSDNYSGCGVEYSSEEYNPFDVYAPSEKSTSC